MLCIKPFVRQKVEYGCGQCITCRINRRRMWTARIALEAACHPYSSFVTLTYDDAQLPANGSLSKAHWREFTKGLGYRYFGCGEYGSRTLRPHYHVLVFGAEPLLMESVASARWSKGFISVRPYAQAHPAYLAGYVVKKLNKSSDPRLPASSMLPEFAMMSKRPGVGVPFIDRMVGFLQSEEGSKFINRTGDVPCAVKISRVTYPLGRTMVLHLRRAVGLPDRVADFVDGGATKRSLARNEAPQEVIEARRVTAYHNAKYRKIKNESL